MSTTPILLDHSHLGPLSCAGGMNEIVDSILLGDSESPESKNFSHRGGRLAQRPGSEQNFDMSALNRSGRWTGLYHHRFRNDLDFLCLVSKDKFYSWDGASFVDRSGSVLTSTNDLSPWNISSGADGTLSPERTLFLVNGTNPILYWSSSAGTPAATAAVLTSHPSYTGGPTNLAARYVVVIGGRVIFGYMLEDSTTYVQRTRMSRLNNFLDFNSTQGAQAVDHADSPGFITGLARYGSNLVILKSDSIILGTETGNGLNPFVYPVSFDTGCLEGRSFKPLTPLISIFLGIDNFYIFTGGEPEPVGDRIRSSLFRDLNYSRTRQIVAGCDYSQNIYRCWVPVGSSDYATRAYCFNWIENIWWIEEWPGEIHSFGSDPTGTTTTIGSLSGTLESYSSTTIGSWSGATSFERPVFGVSYSSGDNQIFKFNKLNYDALSSPNTITPTWESKDFRLVQGRKSTTQAIVVHYSSPISTTLTVGVSTDRGEVFNSFTQSAPAGNRRRLYFNIRVTGDFHRFRISTNSAFEFSALSNPIEIQAIEVIHSTRGQI
jgi:hypothetical protein